MTEVKIELKKCSKCKRALPMNSDYYHNKRDGFMSSCKECSKGRFTRNTELKDGEMYCVKCYKILPFNENYFPIDKSAKDGFRKTCHVCSGRLKGYGAKRNLYTKPLEEGQKYNEKPTIEDVLKYCASIGAICKSTEYINSKKYLVFECPTCSSVFEKTYVELKSGKRVNCSKCSRKISTKDADVKRKIDSFKEVIELCKDIELKLVSTLFSYAHDDLEFECARCEEVFKRKWVVLKLNKSNTCHRCSQKIVAENRSYKIEEVVSIFETEGCTLITLKYTNNKQKLEYICSCGELDEKALSNFIMGQRCYECSTTKRADSLRTPYEEVKRIFEDQGCELLSKEFIHSNIPLDYKCVCGNNSKIKLPAFKYGARCRECFIKRNSGSNNHNWNPNLTDEDRMRNRNYPEYVEWRSKVYKRDDYTCQACGERSGDLEAHHKDSHHWCKDRRTDVENGETLCSSCHALGEYGFHRIYGYKNNTEQQYVEWQNLYVPFIVLENKGVS